MIDVRPDGELRIGGMHRGVEKLLETRDYRQGLALVNLHSWESSFHGELGYALAIERLLGMQVPERAVWMRTLLAEMTRVAHHSAFLGAHQVTEQVRRLIEAYAGNRIHPMVVRVGGLRVDSPAGWFDAVAEFAQGVQLPSVDVISGGAGVGVVGVETAHNFGASGPVGRASGLDIDLRRDAPYLAYQPLLDGGVLRVVRRDGGDVAARRANLADEITVSVDLINACAARLGSGLEGPIDVKLPKVLRLPEGQTYLAHETPAGIAGYLVVSRAERSPWRVKLRTPSFAHAQIANDLIRGASAPDSSAIIDSMCLVAGDIDR